MSPRQFYPAPEKADSHRASVKARQIAGFSLIEFLVALTILSLGLTGLAALHNRTLQSLQDVAHRQRALILATDIAERMAANTAAAAEGQYTLTGRNQTHSTDCTVGCEPSQLAKADLAQWQHNIAAQLPDGEGTVVRRGSVYSIRLNWRSVFSQGAADCPSAEKSRPMACMHLDVAL